MDFREYELKAAVFMNPDLDDRGALLMVTLGIGSESGEIIEQVKHHAYHGHKLDNMEMIKELGDMLWYVAAMCGYIGVSMEDVAKRNIEKLTKRYPDGFTSTASINRDTSRE
jgi:NTP pyrophosphatase (non-canonical NTP hydrolase)